MSIRFALGLIALAAVTFASSVALAQNFTGTAGDDPRNGGTIVGTNQDDRFTMYGGQDKTAGIDGADVFDMGDGADKAYGGNGFDDLDGKSGQDYMEGNDGNDAVKGDNAGDWIVGGKNNDVVRGADGDDIVDGSDDSFYRDEVNGGAGTNDACGIDQSPSGQNFDYGFDGCDGYFVHVVNNPI